MGVDKGTIKRYCLLHVPFVPCLNLPQSQKGQLALAGMVSLQLEIELVIGIQCIEDAKAEIES